MITVAGFLSELRHGARQLFKSPSFTVPSVLGLALGIGATTAVFSIVDAMLLRSMGFSDVERIVSVWQTDPKRGQKHVEVSYGDMQDWSRHSEIFEDVALASSVNLDFPLLGDGQPQQVDGTTVTGSFFRVLGAKPLIGRFLNNEDDRPGAPLRLVVSHRLWQSRYGADPNIAGRQIRAGDGTATIIGVAPPEFDFPHDVDLWVALRASWPTVEKQPRFRVFRSVARLKPGVPVEQAQSRMRVVAEQIGRTLPAGTDDYAVLITPILDEIFGPARTAVWILLGAVCLVLLIACANTANLLLARATVRGRELAIRAVLGAQRSRLVRLLLAEALLLSVAAGALGMVLASVGIAVLVRLAPPDVPRMDGIRMNGTVLGFGLAVSIATVALFGLVPAFIASRRDANEALKQSGRSSTADRLHARLRSALVVSEIALSMVLLAGSGLLLRSFQALAGLDPGFNAERVLTFRITTATGDQEKRRALYSGILERLRALPGVESAGAVLIRPLSGQVGWDSVYMVEGQSPQEQTQNPNANYEAISPDYFRTMGVRLLAGRDFSTADTHTGPGVVIVNESTARWHWGGLDAVGRQLRLGKDAKAPWLTVVGVVKDVRYREWEAVRPDLYVPYLQRAQHRSDFVVKTSGDPVALIEAVRREVFAIDKNQPVSNVTTMASLVDRALSRSRFNSTVLLSLAGAALLLAAIGVYGVLSYTVAQRSEEIGVRMAVGATPSNIVSLVTKSGLRLALSGGGFGLVAALLLNRTLSTLLFAVNAYDPASYAAAALVLLLVAMLACLVPALRAATTDPMRALKSD